MFEEKCYRYRVVVQEGLDFVMTNGCEMSRDPDDVVRAKLSSLRPEWRRHLLKFQWFYTIVLARKVSSVALQYPKQVV